MRRLRLALVLFSFFLVLPAVTRAEYVFPAFPDLPSFALPMGVEDPMDGSDRLFVPERDGAIYVIENDATVSEPTLFLDVSTLLTTLGEGGLLGLAFHPNYENNRFFYVTYTAENPRREVLARFTADATNPDVALPASRLVILEVPKFNLFHNGGCIEFGPDGNLYWSLGEDGQAHLAQDINSLHGKLLRIDVNNPSGGNNYGIPASSPFVGIDGRDEIYALGFRNPWRFSIDPPTGRIWLGDVGQNAWEEINIILKGRNYGWPRMEGEDCFQTSTCDTAGLNVVLPLYVYPHFGSASITGGVVYRGPSMPSMRGKYIYADFITGEMSALSWNGIDPPTNEFVTTLANIPSFGADKDGELFIASFDGDIYRLFASTTGVDPPVASPRLLSVGPNPFHDRVTVSFALAAPARARLEVFDVAGRRVAAPMDRDAGTEPVVSGWNGRDRAGNALASGVYFLRLSVNGRLREVQRITLVR